MVFVCGSPFGKQPLKVFFKSTVTFLLPFLISNEATTRTRPQLSLFARGPPLLLIPRPWPVVQALIEIAPGVRCGDCAIGFYIYQVSSSTWQRDRFGLQPSDCNRASQFQSHGNTSAKSRDCVRNHSRHQSDSRFWKSSSQSSWPYVERTGPTGQQQH